MIAFEYGMGTQLAVHNALCRLQCKKRQLVVHRLVEPLTTAHGNFDLPKVVTVQPLTADKANLVVSEGKLTSTR